MKKNKGFTLIELVMVISIVGVLSIVAVPKYFDLQDQAKNASQESIVGAVRAGLATYYIQNRAYPATLDTAAVGDCSSANPCFATVLSMGSVESDWAKATDVPNITYTGPLGTTYTYTPSTGEFK